MSIKQLKQTLDSPVADLGAVLIDSMQTVPLGSFVLNAIKGGREIRDYIFFKKLSNFLEPMTDMESEVDDFLDGLSDERREKVGEYMIALLDSAESSEKAKLMGFIFKSAVLSEIDYVMMLRLVSIVNRAFVFDLKELQAFKEDTEDFTVEANEFINLGLINNEISGTWKNKAVLKLNEIGITLCRILEKEDWYNK